MASTLFHSPISSSKLHSLTPRCSSSSPSPTTYNKVSKVAIFNKDAYWSDINEQIEAHIRSAVPLHTPPVVHRPMIDLVAAAPRIMAPALCVAAFDLLEESDGHVDHAAVVAIAAGIHVMYAGSWAHQHLPSLLERSGPAHLEPEVELLSGDSIHPLGYEMAAKTVTAGGSDVAAGRLVKVLVEMSRAMGAQGYTSGQYMHVIGARQQLKLNHMTAAREVSARKEGELCACGAVCGAIMAGAGKADAERLRRFGRCVGTINGLLGRRGSDEEEEMMAVVDELKDSALMELQEFDDQVKANAISSILGIACNIDNE